MTIHTHAPSFRQKWENFRCRMLPDAPKDSREYEVAWRAFQSGAFSVINLFYKLRNRIEPRILIERFHEGFKQKENNE